ncbi:c-type cytochrome [Leeia oryzae]|uniref:c-type cytochrome n=1 Tax=Leeia oryzae TaxID=356662 RepID=UPI00036FC2B4|nr:cytochrome c [Leeia oryzae]
MSAWADTSNAPDPARQQALLHLLHQDCGACHGLTLKGGLGSPLTPQALSGKPMENLVATIMNGRPGTPMPPWKPFMSEAEAEWLVQWLQSQKPLDPNQ